VPTKSTAGKNVSNGKIILLGEKESAREEEKAGTPRWLGLVWV